MGIMRPPISLLEERQLRILQDVKEFGFDEIFVGAVKELKKKGETKNTILKGFEK